MIVRIRLTSSWRNSRGVHALAAASAALVLCATTTADVPASAVRLITVSRPDPDPRIARLEKFFGIYHCPAPYHVPEYLSAADGNGLDYRLLPAISIRETHCGIYEKDHNRLGFHPGQGGFPSIEAGIDFIGRRLAGHFLYKGKCLQGKLYTYNPLPAYPDEVQRIMRQIE